MLMQVFVQTFSKIRTLFGGSLFKYQFVVNFRSNEKKRLKDQVGLYQIISSFE